MFTHLSNKQRKRHARHARITKIVKKKLARPVGPEDMLRIRKENVNKVSEEPLPNQEETKVPQPEQPTVEQPTEELDLHLDRIPAIYDRISNRLEDLTATRIEEMSQAII